MNYLGKASLQGLVGVLLSLSALAQSPLAVSEARASQRKGTKLVDVYYDVSGGTAPYSVTLEGSLDGGATWTLPVTSVSGNVGGGVVAGANRKVTWDAGADWIEQVSENVRFRVNVEDSGVRDGFVLIPAGIFQMGDQLDFNDFQEMFEPVHSVNVSEFYMGKYEVTKGLWDEVRSWGLSNGYTDLPLGNGIYTSKGANHPVHSISWYDIVKWCNARSQKEGLAPSFTVSGATYKTGISAPVCNWNANGYRLPTEAEWEKAARGGLVGKRFPWGDTITHSRANYFVNNIGLPENEDPFDLSPTKDYHPSYDNGGFPYTSPVGSFSPNTYGIYDIVGNLEEYCADYYDYKYYTESPATDPRGPAMPTSIDDRVTRCNSWATDSQLGRIGWRMHRSSNDRLWFIGFRLARSSTTSDQ